jgi:DNA-binding NarL/FixJ family response regulator
MSQQSSAGRILAVDDTPVNIDVLETILVPNGFELEGVASGEAALTAIEANPPDLVLLDVVMPGMDGIEVCRRLRADPVTRNLPIVMVTASAGQERLRALEAGADDFLPKPIDRAELLARVRSLVRIKRYLDTIESQAAELAEWNRTLETRVQQQVAELERLNRLRRLLPSQLAELVLTTSGESVLESHRREIAVVACRLRGFAAFAETTEPEVVMATLQEYHASLGEEIARYEGTTGQIAGDQLTVFFNDPMPCPEPAEQAARLALGMRDRLEELSGRWRRRGHDLGFAAGIELGYATLGTIGFEGRRDYAAVGSVTTVAAGLCRAADDGQVLISQRVLSAIEDWIDCAPVGELAVGGLSRPLVVYNAVGVRPAGEPSSAATGPSVLTPREREVLDLLAKGMNNRQIADELIIGVRTAETHVERILRKLNLENRTQAMLWAREQA